MNFIEELRHDLKELDIYDNIDTAILLYIACTSRMLNNKISITLTGESGTGKSTLAKTILGLIPKDSIIEQSYITKAAFHRMDDLRHTILYIQEHIEDKNLAKSFRLLASEKKVTHCIAERNKTKEFVLKGPAVVIETTTTPEKIDFQNRNRNLFIEVSLSHEERTRRFDIIKRRRKSPFNTFAHKHIIEKHHKYQNNLDDNLCVTIPFAESIHFRGRHAYTQRLLENFLNIVSTITFLSQNNRKHKIFNGNIKYIESTVDDYEIAYKLVNSIKIDTGSELMPKYSADLFSALKGNPRFVSPTPFTRNDISIILEEWTNRRIRTHIKPLLENDLLYCKSGLKNKKEYIFTDIGRDLSPDNIFLDCFQSLPNPTEITMLTSLPSLTQSIGQTHNIVV